jgi:hypothetical protein
MENLSGLIVTDLADCFEDLARRLNQQVQDVPEEKFWVKPFPYGNSVGHLVLHLTGNLNYYIGTQIAQTGYLRDRDREFTEANPKSKAEVMKEFDEAIAMVVSTIKAQSPEDWAKAYSGVGVPGIEHRFGIFLRCSIHLHHHIGQLIYLAKELARQ